MAKIQTTVFHAMDHANPLPVALKSNPAKLTAASTDREALASWLMNYQTNKNTLDSFRREGHRFLMWIEWNGFHLAGLKTEHLNAYWRFLRSPEPREYWCAQPIPKTLNGKPNSAWRPVKPAAFGTQEWKPFVSELSVAGVRQSQTVLFVFLEYLANTKYIPANPMRVGKRRRKASAPKVVDRYLSLKVISFVLQHIERMPGDSDRDLAKKDRVRFAFTFLCLTGLRRFEFVGATTSDIYENEDGWWIKVNGKGDKPGEVPIPREAVSAYLAYRKSLDRPPLPVSPEPLLYDVFGKRPIGEKMLYALLKDVFTQTALELKKTNPRSARTLDQASTHWLRHSSATMQLDAGVPLLVVKDNLRHASVSTTQKYLHKEKRDRYEATQDLSLGGSK